MEKLRIRAGALVIVDDSVLLIEYKNEDGDGVHYNLPAGGVDPGETLAETVIREAKEEASADVVVGHVAFIYEYQPVKNNHIYGDVHSIGIMFDCELVAGSRPKFPDNPAPNQIGVRWIPISDLPAVQLYPEITQDIINYHRGITYRTYVEEHEIQDEKRR